VETDVMPEGSSHLPGRPSAALAAAVALSVAGCAAPRTPTVSFPPTSAAAEASAVALITERDIHARIGFLASDALRGRDTPSPGLEAAAAYIVSEHQRFGLTPAGENGTFYQRYPFPLRALDTATVHFGTVAAGGRDNRMLAYGTDFYVAAAAPRPGVEMNHGAMVYLGRSVAGGLPPGEYAGLVPMVGIDGMPSRDWRAAVARTRRAAEAAGAAGVVIVLDARFPDSTFRAMAASARHPSRAVPAVHEIPAIYLTDRAARGIAQRAGIALEREVAGATELPGILAHFAADARVVDDAWPPNVAAVLPGRDPALRGEYVVLSAHMDHVGVGAAVAGDSIYNGADDNASGTVALLEVARALASLPEAQRPRRSVIFLHVSGEEKGLLGSRWFADHPTVPVERIVANVNVDMIGRNAPDSIVVIGKEYSTLGALVNRVAARHPELGLTASDDLWPEQQFFFRSDHFNFARLEIPSIFFFSGVHEDYHRPSDHLERIDLAKTTRVTRLLFHTVREIADAGDRPAWDPRGLETVRALTR
jgi:hypothetical protein